MAIPDISALTFEELITLKDEVEKLIAARRDEERRKFLEATESMRKALGLEVTAREEPSIVSSVRQTLNDLSASSPRTGGMRPFGRRVGPINDPDAEFDHNAHYAEDRAKTEEPIRFRGPNGETWTGRGPKAPQWILDLEAQGRHREEFRIAGRPMSAWKRRQTGGV